MLRIKMYLVSVLIALLAMLTPAVDASTPSMMAVTFPSQSGWTVSGIAGAPGYEQAHWVNTKSDQSSWGTTYALVDNTGAATGATMDWYESEIWSWYFDAADNDDERMMDSSLGSCTGTTGIRVIGIPYESYDVVIYFSSKLEFSTVAKYTVGSSSVYAQTPAATLFGDDDTYVQVPSTSTSDLQGNTPSGNYIVFKGVTGSVLNIQAVAGWYGNSIYTGAAGAPRSSISGFQIVDAGPLAPVAPKYEKAMAVTFPSQSGWTVTGTAGAPGYAQANWVNTSSDYCSWGNVYNLVDNNGVATGAVMNYYASEIWSWCFDAADNDDERMMDCGIGCATGIAEVNVADIPYGSYDVVVYFSSKMEFPFVAKYTAGSTSVYAQNRAMTLFGDDDTYVQVPLTSTEDLGENTPAGNYIVFEGLTGPTLNIKVQAGWYGNSIYNYLPGAPRGAISGFQIINTCNNKPNADLNVDCAVDFLDLKIVADNWLKAVDEFSDARSTCANNELIYAPQIPAITVDGDFSDWTSASDWALFGKWYSGGNEGTTQARYAWNDAANKLYIGIETTESELLVLEVGGLMGDLSDVNALPSEGIQATQIAFSGWSGGVVGGISNQSEGTVDGVQAAYTVNGSTIRIEIATPIYSNWKDSATGMDLTNHMDIYEYADIFSDDYYTMADHQCADGAYYDSYSTYKTMSSSSLIRLVQSLPRTLEDIPEVYRHELIDLNNDSVVDLQDFAKVAAEWLQGSDK